MIWMKQIWDDLKQEILFNCWCTTGLIVYANSVLKNSEVDANSEIKEIKAHLLKVLPLHFHSNIKELIILDE